MSFGRLGPAPASNPISDINVTPLVDVMLVLVVIFIVTAPLLASAIRLDLPAAQSARPGDVPAFVTVALDPQGQIFVDDQPVELAELTTRLKSAAQRGPETELRLRADQAVPYGRVVDVLDAAQQAGMGRIGFIAEPPSRAR